MRALLSLVGAAALAAASFEQARAQDAAAGEQTFAECRICHQIGPGAQNQIGPNLDGVVGRKAGTEPGYDYSDALRKANLTWNAETLSKWLKDPQAFLPGTKMTFAGLSSAGRIADVIAYLAQFNSDGSRK